ncbi:MAG: hypothetical protein MZU84_01535 [Sphingobacterium sp.]|nr:hypothetical protein [Sphingobacterium sp.]
MALKSGRAIRFNEKTVRPMGRNAAGVRGGAEERRCLCVNLSNT